MSDTLILDDIKARTLKLRDKTEELHGDDPCGSAYVMISELLDNLHGRLSEEPICLNRLRSLVCSIGKLADDYKEIRDSEVGEDILMLVEQTMTHLERGVFNVVGEANC